MNEFLTPYPPLVAALGPQASFHPSEVLEGGAHSGAHQAEEGDGAQGPPVPFAGLWGEGREEERTLPAAPQGQPLAPVSPSLQAAGAWSEASPPHAAPCVTPGLRGPQQLGQH